MAELPEKRPTNDDDIVRTRSTGEPEIVSTARPAGYEQVDRVVETPNGVSRRERTVVDRSGGEHYESIMQDRAAEQQLRLYKAEQVVWLIFGIIEILIGLRVFLKIIGANPANGFAHFIYGVSALFLGPFFGLTSSPSSGRMVLEVPSLIAMIVYVLVAWGIIQVLRLIFVRRATKSISTYDHYRS